MTDATTQQPLQVSTDGTAGPYIMVPVSQLDEVKQLLGDRRLRYWDIPEHYHREKWELIRKIITDISNAAIAKVT